MHILNGPPIPNVILHDALWISWISDKNTLKSERVKIVKHQTSIFSNIGKSTYSIYIDNQLVGDNLNVNLTVPSQSIVYRIINVPSQSVDASGSITYTTVDQQVSESVTIMVPDFSEVEESNIFEFGYNKLKEKIFLIFLGLSSSLFWINVFLTIFIILFIVITILFLIDRNNNRFKLFLKILTINILLFLFNFIFLLILLLFLLFL